MCIYILCNVHILTYPKQPQKNKYFHMCINIPTYTLQKQLKSNYSVAIPFIVAVRLMNKLSGPNIKLCNQCVIKQLIQILINHNYKSLNMLRYVNTLQITNDSW